MVDSLVDLFMHPQIERKRFPYQGVLKSLVLDQLSEQASNDIIELANLHNAAIRQMAQLDGCASRDIQALAKRISTLEKLLEQQAYLQAVDGMQLPLWHTFRDAGPVSYFEDTPLTLRAMVDTVYGEATVPINGIQSKFYSSSPRTGTLIAAENLSFEVTGIFDKQGGDGLVDYEHDDQQTRLDEGDPALAFNGSNLDRWVRRIEFDLDSDVDSIETQLTVRVPASLNIESNLLSIRAHPNGSVDITGLFTAADLSESFVQVSGFEALDNAQATRWHFPATQVRQIRVWFRQRNWIEENGKKVFYVGAEEIGLFLVDWDKTWVPAGELTDNHSLIVNIDAPEGYVFNTLHHFRTDPMFSLEDVGSRHVHIIIATDEDLLNQVWNSDVDQLPQSLVDGTDLEGVASSLYVLMTLNWVQTSGGVNSPYQVNTPPVVYGFGLQTTVVPE